MDQILILTKTTGSPFGTGPYKFVKWDTGKRIELEVNEKYRGKKPVIRRSFTRLFPNRVWP